jgi:hypothetical protein
MNTRKAAPAIAVLSLVVLLSGCAAAASDGGQVRDDLSPAANSAIIGLARGHVIVRDNLSPLARGPQQESVAQAAPADAQRAWSAEARREFHASATTTTSTVAKPFSAAAMRELKADAPVQVADDLSPLNSDNSASTPQPDTVDDDLSPLRDSR